MSHAAGGGAKLWTGAKPGHAPPTRRRHKHKRHSAKWAVVLRERALEDAREQLEPADRERSLGEQLDECEP